MSQRTHTESREVSVRSARVLLGWPVRTHDPIPEGDAGTVGRTVPWMRQLVVEGRADPLVHEFARNLIASNPDMHPVETVFRAAQSMRYAYDEEILGKAGVDDDTSELLQGAPYQVEKTLLGGPQANIGDCDDRAILVQSMLESVGFPTRFVLVRGPGRPDFSHVYSEVLVDGGGWAPLDTIMDGIGGRPLLGPGQEIGAPVARDRTTIAVDPQYSEPASCWPLLALAAFFLFRR